MARSLGFGSTALYLFALLRLAFASAPCFPLNLAQYHNSPAHSAKGTLSRINALELFVSIWFQYSISLPSRGSFHLSLTVLCAIGRQVVFCLGGWSPLLPARFHVSRSTLDTSPIDFFSPTGVLPSVHGLSKPFD